MKTKTKPKITYTKLYGKELEEVNRIIEEVENHKDTIDDLIGAVRSDNGEPVILPEKKV